jgi:hypothetical protein
MQSFHRSPQSSFEPQWKFVPNWSKYEVSDDGRVRRNGRESVAIPAPRQLVG